MIKYMKETLGLDVTMKSWNNAEKLPVGIYLNREYYRMELEGLSMIVVRIPQNEIARKRLQSYNTAIRKICDLHVVFWFDAISPYQRKMLVSDRIAFVVPGSQCYIPFLAMSFKERMPSAMRHVSCFSAAAQVIVLYALYHPNEKEIPQSILSDKTGISIMAVSRGIKELEELGIVDIRTNGRRRILCFRYKGKKLYDSVKDFMVSPVLDRYYMKKSEQIGLCIAGESALSQKTMMNPPLICNYAMKREARSVIQEKSMDYAWYSGDDVVIIEVWKYDPAVFAQNGLVDPISLVLSFKDNQDERIEGEIKRLTEVDGWYLE